MASINTVVKELKKTFKKEGRGSWANRHGYTYDYAYRLDTGRLPISEPVALTVGYSKNRKGEYRKVW